MFTKEVVVDCKGHLLGRLASVLAKELLNGQNVVCVRTEDVNISGSLYRNKLKYAEFKRKTNNSNPKHGPFHFRAPSKILWRTIRGMIPHKTARGAAALDRLKSYEGCPHPYDVKKKMVIPQALKVLRLRPERRFCRLGELSSEFGWKHGDLVQRLEARRKERTQVYYKKKLQVGKVRAEVVKKADAAMTQDERILLSKAYGI
uniref:60S ribosomal protein L13a n=1 Tax=Noctiluca scintillans TaxID=2966 RepID=A0A7S1AD99_NOCSC|mmetsp:Transcript_41644/g.110219  ORF Transcript_41644/g.110219 Transcript_41644/m.110219 type:complete len:203 (+) Transcript_41644:65-673(+)|eukprot:CAMPEP_0194501826 /NCGR_PEP_ID=MMETSP0253-20130528/23255_1 /TAXON_ID=2966 /ORGANISM="Noctiluca scintillans" /LENGTH=202 /DNA_ID=CAMNT_0039343869 /DNA_START=65 /DNA_END=673 /DNA_ORIENTATION=-